MAQENDRRRLLRDSCRQRHTAGGVYQIVNIQTGKRLICAQRDLDGSKNRFDFSVMTGSCVHPRLAQDWSLCGPQAFRFEILEQLEKKSEQTDRQFDEDLEVLRGLWLEKFESRELY